MVNTAFLLMAQYNARVVIPLPEVLRDYFGGLSREKFLAKVDKGEIRIPITRMERSQRGMVGISLVDLAAYLDARMEEARKELEAMSR